MGWKRPAQERYYYKNRDVILRKMREKQPWKLIDAKTRREKWNDWAKKNPEKNRARMKRWRDKHKDYRRKYYKKNRLVVLIHYGGDTPKCACCGENHVEFLEIDHIHGGGTKDRKKRKYRGTNFYIWLRLNNFPEGFQVLCANCNRAKGRAMKRFCPVHYPELYEENEK